MSGIERNKTEPLTAREIEEEEMAQELMNMGMYEHGLSYDQMKDILGVISESKHMAKMETEGRVSRRISQLPSESPSKMILESNLPQQVATENDVQLSKTSYAYRTNCLYEQKLSPEAESCESLTNVFEKRSPQNRYRFRDIDISVDKLYKDPNIKENELLSLNRIQGAISQETSYETQNSQSTELKIEVQPKQNQKIERWRLNPLDVLVDENDVPLSEFERPMGQERAPFSFCNNTRTSETRDKIIAALSNHLEEVAQLWRGWQRTTTDTDFQWGAPIKVGSANGSFETKYISSKLKGSMHRERERTYKRKASTIEAGNPIHCNDDEDNIDDNGDDTDELIFLKKKKSDHRETRNTTCEYPSTIQEPSYVLKNDRSQESNDSQRELERINPRKLRSRNQRNQLDEAASTSQYPRRIVPPNPTSKTRGPRRRKNETHTIIMKENILLDTDEKDTVTNLKSDNRNYMLSDQALAVELEKNRHESRSTEQARAKGVPSSDNRMTNRLQEQCTRLKHLRDEEETKKREDIEVLRRQEEEARRHRVEVYKKYVKEEEEKSRREEEKRKEENEKTERWRRRMKQREKESREHARKINDEELKKRMVEEELEEMLLRESDGVEELHDSEETETDNRINCPICNKSFPTEEIENHAAVCEQYDIAEIQETNKVTSYRKKMPDLELSGGRSKTSLECQICSSFSTNDGNEYEDHVHGCLENQKKRLDDDRTRASSSSMVLSVPTSPIRCFVPISQQRDCEINYRAQFPSTDRQRAYTGRKRKR